jgi:hypothetical protein
MVTRLEIDTDLLQAAIALDQGATPETIVEKALREYIQLNAWRNKADLDRFDEVLARVPDVDPVPGDELL